MIWGFDGVSHNPIIILNVVAPLGANLGTAASLPEEQLSVLVAHRSERGDNPNHEEP